MKYQNDSVKIQCYMIVKDFPTSINALIAWSKCSLVWAAESCTLILALSLGTTG